MSPNSSSFIHLDDMVVLIAAVIVLVVWGAHILDSLRFNRHLRHSAGGRR